MPDVNFLPEIEWAPRDFNEKSDLMIIHRLPFCHFWVHRGNLSVTSVC